jgi:hypothetical protein
MSVNKFNTEGYLDPTVYEALTNMEKEEKQRKRKKLVFICSPFAGDIETNTRRARRYGRYAVAEKVVPIIPHLMYPQFLEEGDPEERQLGIDMGLVLLSRCHELWVFGDRISSGMSIEIARAKRWNIPIRYFNTTCEETGGAR